MRLLRLTLKKKWFYMIVSGEKTEEYREIKPYWTNRLFDFNGPAPTMKPFTHIEFIMYLKGLAGTLSSCRENAND